MDIFPIYACVLIWNFALLWICNIQSEENFTLLCEGSFKTSSLNLLHNKLVTLHPILSHLETEEPSLYRRRVAIEAKGWGMGEAFYRENWQALVTVSMLGPKVRTSEGRLQDKTCVAGSLGREVCRRSRCEETGGRG